MQNGYSSLSKKGTWRYYNIFDGLAHNIVNSICQDHSGLLWFGTHGGISRFDGKDFTNFTIRDGLANNRVWAIYQSNDGIMWFGTENGVSCYNGESFTAFGIKDGLVDNGVNVIYHTSDDSLWFGTYKGVFRFDGNTFTNITTKDGLVYDEVYSIYEGTDGMVWFGTWNGVSRYSNGIFTNFTAKDGLSNNVVRSICHSPDGYLWFGTQEGISRYDGEKFVNFTTKDGLAGNVIRAIHSDADGILWIGTGDGGVSRYDGKAFVNLNTEDGLVNNNVRAIYRASDGSLWFGTGVDGISRYDEKTLVGFTNRDGMPNNIVRAIYQTPDDCLWLGTEGGGITFYNGKEFVIFTTKEALINDYIWSIYRDSNGLMWFGTERGISYYDGKKFASLTTKDGLAGDYVRAIQQDTYGSLWFGTLRNGVSRYDGKEFVNFTTRDGLAGDTVRSICLDVDGNLWFGTDNGVSRYGGNEFINFSSKEGLPSFPVWTIYQDAKGILWFGTEGGVSKYDGECFTKLTTQDGLVNDFVISIFQTDDGVMWFGTSGFGISRYDGTIWTSLDTRDGLAGNIIYAIIQDSNRNIWFATDRGISRYKGDNTAPRVNIIAISANKRLTDLDALEPIIVGTRVTFEYNSIDFKTHHQKRLYRCGISEIANESKRISAKNSKENINTSDLTIAYGEQTKETKFDWIPDKTGTYIFQAQAIDRDGNYSPPAMAKLNIQPDPQDVRLLHLQKEIEHLRSEVSRKYDFENILGNSVAIKQVYALMEKAIDSGLTVLITGETGTGKELVAKAIHYNSQRKNHPILERNCGALPKELLADELFGHARGAFTGADKEKPGLFEVASGGTILLDEIGEMPPDAQVHLLRVLQERKVQRLGEYNLRDVDVRVIAMTNRDLEREANEGRFRSDLYYRLSEFTIHIPLLRERADDIPLLAEHFLEEARKDMKKNINGFTQGIMEMLQSYSWPGNIRELRNEIRRSSALVEDGIQIQAYHLSNKITNSGSLTDEVISDTYNMQQRYRDVLDDFERRYIMQALQTVNGNRLQAAKLLGVERKSLYEKMKRLNIDK